MDVVNPEGRWRPGASYPLVVRPATVRGAVVGLLDNNKPGATELFTGLVPRLRELGAANTISRRKVHPAGPSPYLSEVANRADVAISALGD